MPWWTPLNDYNLIDYPFQHIHSKGCLRWFKLPYWSDHLMKSFVHFAMPHFRPRVSKRLVSCGKWIKRQSASSNYPTKYLSPANVKKQKEMHKQKEQKTRHCNSYPNFQSRILPWMILSMTKCPELQLNCKLTIRINWRTSTERLVVLEMLLKISGWQTKNVLTFTGIRFKNQINFTFNFVLLGHRKWVNWWGSNHYSHW